MTFAQTVLATSGLTKQHFDHTWLSSQLRDFQTLLATRASWDQQDAIEHIQAELGSASNRTAFRENGSIANCASPAKQQASKLQHASVDAYLAQAITIAYSSSYPQAHDVMCAALAQAIDKKPLGMLRDALGKAHGAPNCSSPLSALSSKSALTVLAAVRDLDKAMQLQPCWQKLLRQPEAEVVYLPRLAAAAPLYRQLLSTHRADDMTWQDAFVSYTSVCDGTAPQAQLQQLLQLSLEILALGTPQHLGELTFFVTILAALEAHAGSVAAAESLFTATCAIRNALQERLAAVTQSSPALGAVEHFTLLAQLRQLLSRCREVVHTLVAPSVQRTFLAQLAALQDETMVTFTVSDKALAFLRALPHAAVVASPLLTAFLAGPYANMLPQRERERLAVPQPMTGGALPVRAPVSIRCCGGATVPIDLQLLQPLERLRDLIAIFARWQAQGQKVDANACGDVLSPRKPAHSEHAPQARLQPIIAAKHSSVPLPVQPAVLRSILDCAFGVTMEPVIGGAAAKHQYLQSWQAEMLTLPAQQRQAVAGFASLLGFAECVRLVGGGGDAGMHA